MSPNNILNMAYLKELNMIAITDHNSCLQLDVFEDLKDSYEMLIIPGVEVEVKEKYHVLCLFKSFDSARKFQKMLNVYLDKRMHDEKIYGEQNLFDTFDGFDNNDMNVEIDNGFTTQEWFDSWNNFKNTYIDLVLEKMKYRDQCIVRKGYFPDTIPEEEMTFALVSLDCDLYEPILAGLRYFYPRLNEGGYIMLHDYNQSDHLKGVKKAVDEYEKEVGHRIIKIPIPDVCGTLVISK